MHRRVLFPLMAGLLGLVAVAPVITERSALAVGSEAFKATTTTDPDSAPDGDTDTGSDSDSDGSTDSGTDSSSDSSADAGSDTGNDGSADGGTDSGYDPDGDSGTPETTEPRSGSDSGSARSSSQCDEPLTDRGPAPQVGEAAQTYEAGEAGTVEVERLSETELRIAGVSPNDGWTEEIRSASGPRVNVRFTRQGQSPSLIRFAASMDQRGTEIHIRVTNCG